MGVTGRPGTYKFEGQSWRVNPEEPWEIDGFEGNDTGVPGERSFLTLRGQVEEDLSKGSRDQRTRQWGDLKTKTRGCKGGGSSQLLAKLLGGQVRRERGNHAVRHLGNHG